MGWARARIHLLISGFQSRSWACPVVLSFRRMKASERTIDRCQIAADEGITLLTGMPRGTATALGLAVRSTWK